jgi:polysaccharide export outer membrane protein
MDEKFNTAAKLISESNNSINTSTNYGFWVNNEGSIVLHLLGIYNVEGLTKNELAAKLEKDLLPFMKEPIVTVAFLNKKITVIGEVSSPKVLYMNKEEMNLIEVLVNSGEFKENAMVQDIMVIRDSADHKIIKHLNLEDHSIFMSPWYYIKPDDIIYVKKDYDRYDKEERRRTLQTTVSLTATTISLIVIIINIFFK